MVKYHKRTPFVWCTLVFSVLFLRKSNGWNAINWVNIPGLAMVFWKTLLLALGTHWSVLRKIVTWRVREVGWENSFKYLNFGFVHCILWKHQTWTMKHDLVGEVDSQPGLENSRVLGEEGSCWAVCGCLSRTFFLRTSTFYVQRSKCRKQHGMFLAEPHTQKGHGIVNLGV